MNHPNRQTFRQAFLHEVNSMRQVFARSIVGLCCALLAGLPAGPVLAQQRSARLKMVFLQLAPGGNEMLVMPDARDALTEGELGMLMEFGDFDGVVSLARVVEVTDADLSGVDRRAVMVLSRWKANGVDRSISLPLEPGAIYLVALPSKEHGEVTAVFPSSKSERPGPSFESGRWIHLSIDPRDRATVRYSIDRPGRADLEGTAFVWRD